MLLGFINKKFKIMNKIIILKFKNLKRIAYLSLLILFSSCSINSNRYMDNSENDIKNHNPSQNGRNGKNGLINHTKPLPKNNQYSEEEEKEQILYNSQNDDSNSEKEEIHSYEENDDTSNSDEEDISNTLNSNKEEDSSSEEEDSSSEEEDSSSEEEDLSSEEEVLNSDEEDSNSQEEDSNSQEEKEDDYSNFEEEEDDDDEIFNEQILENMITPRGFNLNANNQIISSFFDNQTSHTELMPIVNIVGGPRLIYTNYKDLEIIDDLTMKGMNFSNNKKSSPYNHLIQKKTCSNKANIGEKFFMNEYSDLIISIIPISFIYYILSEFPEIAIPLAFYLGFNFKYIRGILLRAVPKLNLLMDDKNRDIISSFKTIEKN